MSVLIHVLVALLVLLQAVPARAGDDRRDALIGRWVGSDDKQRPGLVVIWRTDRRSDGTLAIEFRTYQGCQLLGRQWETGFWSLDGNRLRSITGTINGRPVRPPYVDDYVVERLDAKELHYRTKTGLLFKARRNMDGGFPMPACDTRPVS